MTSYGLPQITPALLQPLLASRFPDMTVTAVHMDGVIHGTATKIRISLDATGPGPRTMWVKGGWEESSEVLRKVGIFAREPRAYAELLPALGLEVPACYGAAWDDETLDGIVLLEDLSQRNARFHSPLEPLPPATVVKALGLLARLHAQTHGDQWQSGNAWLRPLFADAVQPDSYLAQVGSAATLAEFLALPRGNALPEAARDPAKISAAFHRTVAFGCRDEERCVIHGDAHIGNSYTLPDGDFGLLDWQCVWRGGWAFDVAYLIGSALLPADRRDHEVPLLQHYLKERARLGWTAPALEQAFDRYRQYLAYGLTVWLTNLPSFQPEEFNAAVAARFAHAMIDHGLFDG